MYKVSNNRAYRERIAVESNSGEGYQSYDSDNLYPDRVENVVFSSGTATTCTERLAEFITGEGFHDDNFNKAKVGRRGETVNKIRDLNSVDFSLNKGFALLIRYNANYKKRLVTAVKFKYCRMGAKNEKTGWVDDILYSTDWAEAQEDDIKKYPIYNPDPEQIKREAIKFGGILNHPGQILYWTPETDLYPRATIDPVFDDVQNSGEMPTYLLANIQNGLSANFIWKYWGEFESDEDARKYKREIEEASGAEGSGTTIVAEVPNPEDGDRKIIERIDMQNKDSMFEKTAKSVKENIIENFRVPSILVGKQKDSGVFSNEEWEQAYRSYNAETRRERNIISEVYEEVFKDFYIDINPSGDYSIVETAYLSKDDKKQELTLDIIIQLKGSLRDGTLTKESAKHILMDMYGADEDGVNKLLQ